MSDATSPESRAMAAWLAANALLSSDSDAPIGYFPRSPQAPTPLVTASRDTLAEVIGKHPEHYDGDCGYYNGCGCGWDNGTENNNDGYAEHVADALLASGVVRAVDGLAEDEALRGHVEAVCSKWEAAALSRIGDAPWGTKAAIAVTAEVRAALATPTDPKGDA